jgi:hypothetical protein
MGLATLRDAGKRVKPDQVTAANTHVIDLHQPRHVRAG